MSKIKKPSLYQILLLGGTVGAVSTMIYRQNKPGQAKINTLKNAAADMTANAANIAGHTISQLGKDFSEKIR